MYYSYQDDMAGYKPINPDKSRDKCPPPYPEPDMVLARAYVPMQKYGKIYSPEKALKHGSLFPELVRPYKKRGKGGRC
ncbi:MAG TPA: spore coat associated protein CotJA [Bacillota bacterium]|nr:spore coat associated protein CotJA [Bacillota bacterium]